MNTGKDVLIGGEWMVGLAEPFHSLDPATGDMPWQGHQADADQVDRAVRAAREAFSVWARRPLAERSDLVRAFAKQLEKRGQELAEAISRETGKPHWESQTEVQAMIAKVETSIDAEHERRAPRIMKVGDAQAAMRFKPHGVVAVFGPFNLPGHLPNGHIVPALLAGNTVVFKPSESTPLSGQIAGELWREAGLPAGVLNLVQGGREVGANLVQHAGIDGVFFTGGTSGGLAIHNALADQPQKILALEMGGNNPLIVDEVENLDAAAYLTILSAYITAGQRCTCARRLIVPEGDRGDAFINRLIERIGVIRVGKWNDQPQPFMGPMVSARAAEYVLKAQAEMKHQGGKLLVQARQLGAAMLTPGLVDVTTARREDVEYFGPLLQLIRAADFQAAIEHANDTRYGLAAGLLSDDAKQWDAFYHGIRAGVVTWNRQTTGASGKLPFGDVGISGNHRPSGYWAADYCSYPVASMEIGQTSMPSKLLPGIDW